MNTLSLIALAGALAGCESTDPKPEPEGPIAGAVLVKDANNYTSTSTLTPPVIQTAPGVDLQISWPTLTIDMQCHEMSPTADIGQVTLLRFADLEGDTPEEKRAEVAQKLTAGELPQSALDGYAQVATMGATETNLFSLTNFGTVLDFTEEYVEDPEKVYMMLWSSGEDPGLGARAMAFLEPTSASNNDEVEATLEMACDGMEPPTGILTFEAEFHDSLEVPAGATLIDWSGVTVDGLMNEFDPDNIDRVLLAHYEDADETPEMLGNHVFDLETLAEDLWEVTDHQGETFIDLLTLYHSEDGVLSDELFEGFDTVPEGGTWLLGLQCTFCQNPAPHILTIVEPLPEE